MNMIKEIQDELFALRDLKYKAFQAKLIPTRDPDSIIGVRTPQLRKSDFRAVKVKDCVAVPKSKKLLQFTLDDGTGTSRQAQSYINF